ncbi:hypothetical protein [Sphingobacterium sp.]|uniref:hypothetical protein n=1 Tax=Sphingobacterium sp. TaxID=341027 RepID=UPI002896F027|nr:hypothetical protein [Sphingobacterium sp.]
MTKISAKRTLRNDIVINLKNSLSYLGDYLSDKKLDSRLEKASKLLTKGIKEKKIEKRNLEQAKISEKENITTDSAKSSKTPAGKDMKTTLHQVKDNPISSKTTTGEESSAIATVKARTPRNGKQKVEK